MEAEEGLKRTLHFELTYNGLSCESLSTDLRKNLQAIKELPPLMLIFEAENIKDDFVASIKNIDPEIWLLALNSNKDLHRASSLLASGVDAVLTKPSTRDEYDFFLASVKALLRREQQMNRSKDLSYFELSMDLVNRSVRRGDKLIELRAKEFDLLKVFLGYSEEVLSRQFIFDKVWGSSFLGDSNVIEVYIRYLRSKLGKPNLIKTRRGNGYILISDESEISRSVKDLAES